MAQDEITINSPLDYQIGRTGHLVTHRLGLVNRKPKLDAPPPETPGSVDWTMALMFGSKLEALQTIEGLVAGQGENANERWMQFCLLYREWELQYNKGNLPEEPTFNQVCHALNFDARDFLSELQGGIQAVMSSVAHIKASLTIHRTVDAVVEAASDPQGDTKAKELHLRLAGVIDEKGGLSINIQQNNQTILKSDQEKMKSPLLRFSKTVDALDDDAREEIIDVLPADNPQETPAG